MKARLNTMPKYMFETKNKITHCTNCPMRDKETDDCNLQENCGDTWLEQMLDCPLKLVEGKEGKPHGKDY
jgi:hypothetical protein